MKKGAAALGIIGAVTAVCVYFGANSMMTAKMKKQVDNLIADIITLDDIKEVTYDDFSVNVFSSEGVMRDVKAVAPDGAMTVDKVIISNYDFMNKIPRSSEVKFENIRIPFKAADLHSGEKKLFSDFGFEDEIVFSVSTQHEYSAAAKTFNLDFSIESGHLGGCRFGLNLGNLNLKPFEDTMTKAESFEQISPMLLMGTMGGLELNSAFFEFNNTGIIEIAAEKLREEESVFKDAKDVSEVRKIAAKILKPWVAQFAVDFLMNSLSPEHRAANRKRERKDNQSVELIGKFIESGKSIKFTITPEQKNIMALSASMGQNPKSVNLETLEKLWGLKIDVK